MRTNFWCKILHSFAPKPDREGRHSALPKHEAFAAWSDRDEAYVGRVYGISLPSVPRRGKEAEAPA